MSIAHFYEIPRRFAGRISVDDLRMHAREKMMSVFRSAAEKLLSSCCSRSSDNLTIRSCKFSPYG